MSLLREIQNDLSSSGSDVPTVLRKCKILAARLGSNELASWVDFELNGYPESQPIPEYPDAIGGITDFTDGDRLRTKARPAS
jgi:hypothetical protein